MFPADVFPPYRQHNPPPFAASVVKKRISCELPNAVFAVVFTWRKKKTRPVGCQGKAPSGSASIPSGTTHRDNECISSCTASQYGLDRWRQTSGEIWFFCRRCSSAWTRMHQVCDVWDKRRSQFLPHLIHLTTLTYLLSLVTHFLPWATASFSRFRRSF